MTDQERDWLLRFYFVADADDKRRIYTFMAAEADKIINPPINVMWQGLTSCASIANSPAIVHPEIPEDLG